MRPPDVFVRELSALYRAFSRGAPSPLAALPIQYADYAQWQRHWLELDIRRDSFSHQSHRLHRWRHQRPPGDHLQSQSAAGDDGSPAPGRLLRSAVRRAR